MALFWPYTIRSIKRTSEPFIEFYSEIKKSLQ